MRDLKEGEEERVAFDVSRDESETEGTRDASGQEVCREGSCL